MFGPSARFDRTTPTVMRGCTSRNFKAGTLTGQTHLAQEPIHQALVGNLGQRVDSASMNWDSLAGAKTLSLAAATGLGQLIRSCGHQALRFSAMGQTFLTWHA